MVVHWVLLFVLLNPIDGVVTYHNPKPFRSEKACKAAGGDDGIIQEGESLIGAYCLQIIPGEDI